MFKVFKNNEICNLKESIDKQKLLLKTDKKIIINSNDHIEHITAYYAWMQVGGNIYIIPPHYNENGQKNIKEIYSKLEYEDSIFICTSGTTNKGNPKPVVLKKEQMNQALNASNFFIEWESTDKYLNFIPASTIGFWQIIIPAFFKNNFSLFLGDKNYLLDELDKDVNCTAIMPALIDFIEKKKPNFNFSKFKKIITGSTVVSKKHTNFFFKNGGKKLINIYGLTEAGCLLLSNKCYSVNDNPNIWELKYHSKDVEFKIIDKNLHVKGKTLCENISDFEYFDGEWYNTHDVWNEVDKYISFCGRSNDFEKVNAHIVNLLDVDLIAEETDIKAGEVVSVVKHKSNSDYIELFYTNKNIDLYKLKDLYKNKLSKYSTPSKYTYIEKIPRNHMGKKMRNF